MNALRFPSSIMSNRPYRLFSNAKQGSDRAMSHDFEGGQSSYFIHLLTSQFRAVNLLAVSMAILAYHVLGVVVSCSQEQMREVAARGNVAPVADTKAMRDRAVDALPGIPMGSNVFVLANHKPVSAASDQSCPQNASVGIWGGQVTQECFFDGNAQGGVAALARTELARMPLRVGPKNLKRFSANVTDAIDFGSFHSRHDSLLVAGCVQSGSPVPAVGPLASFYHNPNSRDNTIVTAPGMAKPMFAVGDGVKHAGNVLNGAKAD